MVDHPHTIDRWDDTTGETLIEQIAAVGDYLVALETYRAAVQRWLNVKIALRNRARVIEQSWGVNRAVAPPIGAAVVVGVVGPQVRRKRFRYSKQHSAKRSNCLAKVALIERKMLLC